MNTLDIVLLNGLCYMSGILTGLGVCFRYKKHLLLKTTSHEQLSDLMNTLTHEINTTVMGPPVVASAPAADTLKEVIIRSN